MTKLHIPEQGDVYWIDPNPVAGHEMKDRHRFVIITVKEINALGVAMAVPITSSGIFARNNRLTVNVSGHDTTGVAICTQIRSFDILARVRKKTAQYIEKLHPSIVDEIIALVVNIIDPDV